MPRAASGDDTLDRKFDALFERWTAECDADGQLDFYGLQTLICREMVEAGEVLVRRRLRRASDGLPVPLQLQVLEADFLDATKSGVLGAGRLVQGIEFDPVGTRRAYWLHAEHPGDAYGALQNGLQSRPVPATEIAHIYEKQRTQARGVHGLGRMRVVAHQITHPVAQERPGHADLGVGGGSWRPPALRAPPARGPVIPPRQRLEGLTRHHAPGRHARRHRGNGMVEPGRGHQRSPREKPASPATGNGRVVPAMARSMVRMRASRSSAEP
jgi:hypothetical protein